MAEWLGNGLQNRLRRFNSGSCLQNNKPRIYMSKKNKAKFKKHLKTQMLQKMGREVKASEVVQAPSVEKTSSIISASQPPITPKSLNSAAAMTYDPTIVNLPQVKYDLKKTAIIVLILAAIIVILSYLALRYNILISFGDWLFKVLNIK